MPTPYDSTLPSRCEVAHLPTRILGSSPLGYSSQMANPCFGMLPSMLPDGRRSSLTLASYRKCQGARCSASSVRGTGAPAGSPRCAIYGAFMAMIMFANPRSAAYISLITAMCARCSAAGVRGTGAPAGSPRCAICCAFMPMIMFAYFPIAC